MARCAMFRSVATACVATSAFFAQVSSALPGYFQVHNRANFAALPGRHILVDWSSFGPAGTIISTPDTRAFPTGAGPEYVGVSSSQGALAIHQEGVDYTGDFLPGEYLLTDAGSQSDSFVIHFNPGVLAFGFQVDPHYITGPWTGSIKLDVHYGLTIPISGIANDAEDGSAPFIGFVNNRPGINSVTVTINQTDPGLPQRAGALAINMMDVIVPEPPSIALAAAALMALAGYRRRSGRRS